MLWKQFLWSPLGFPGGSMGKNLTANAGNMGSIPESGRPPGEENGYPLQYSCLGNPVDRGARGLQYMRSQRVGHSLPTEQQQNGHLMLTNSLWRYKRRKISTLWHIEHEIFIIVLCTQKIIKYMTENAIEILSLLYVYREIQQLLHYVSVNSEIIENHHCRSSTLPRDATEYLRGINSWPL